MHTTAMANGKRFFDTYVARLGAVTIVDIGSQDVNGSLRDVAPPAARYVGVDFIEAKGVDVIITDPYSLPFEDQSIDVVVSSSCFEHSEMFWLLFNEIMRVLKPTGLFYLNVPSNGSFHRFPVDCWRFYPEAGTALVTWARRCGINAGLLESYVCQQHPTYEGLDRWSDFVAVFAKDVNHVALHPQRILATFTGFENGIVAGHTQILNYTGLSEDLRNLHALRNQLAAATPTT